jgi:hypothetical protein
MQDTKTVSCTGCGVPFAVPIKGITGNGTVVKVTGVSGCTCPRCGCAHLQGAEMYRPKNPAG